MATYTLRTNKQQHNTLMSVHTNNNIDEIDRNALNTKQEQTDRIKDKADM